MSNPHENPITNRTRWKYHFPWESNTGIFFVCCSSWRWSLQNIMRCVKENLSRMFFPCRPATVIKIHFHDGWSKKSHAKIWHPCSDQRIPLFPAIVRHIWYRPKAHKALRESGLVLILVIMRSFFWIGTTYFRNYLTETHGWILGHMLGYDLCC